MCIKTVTVVVLLLVATAALGDQGDTETHPYLSDKFYVDLGLYFPAREVSLSVEGSVPGVRGQFDFDEELGLKKSDETFALNFGWRFARKWQLGGQYFESDGQRSAVLEEDVDWGDYTFGVGTGVRGGLDFTLIRTFFARSFDSADHHDYGIGLGIHWLEIGAFIEGNAVINGEDAGFRRESVRAAAPLPNIGGWYTRSLSPRWSFRARLDWLSADVDKYDGTLINASAGVNYQITENFGIGASYNLFRLDVGVDDNDWRGEVTTSYQGLFAHASAYW